MYRGTALSTFFASLAGAATAFSPDANNNIALYWGQNSAGGQGTQERLSYYCQSDSSDIVLISFLYQFGAGNNYLNIGGACEGSYFAGTNLLQCNTIEEDIKTCQSLGKKVLLSMGGASGAYGFSSNDAASSTADILWGQYGGGTSNTRPFGSAVLDGFDLDIEAGNAQYYPAFVDQMRAHYAQDTTKSYYISAAPQCPLPDASLNTALTQSDIDFIFVQFYNNYCGMQSYGTGNFNFDAWDTFAKTESKNPNAKVYLGVPASPSAAGSGYKPAADVIEIAKAMQKYDSFGGVMMWDASQAWANNDFAGVVKRGISTGITSGNPTEPLPDTPVLSSSIPIVPLPSSSSIVWWTPPTTAAESTSAAPTLESSSSSASLWWTPASEVPTTSEVSLAPLSTAVLAIDTVKLAPELKLTSAPDASTAAAPSSSSDVTTTITTTIDITTTVTTVTITLSESYATTPGAKSSVPLSASSAPSDNLAIDKAVSMSSLSSVSTTSSATKSASAPAAIAVESSSAQPSSTDASAPAPSSQGSSASVTSAPTSVPVSSSFDSVAVSVSAPASVSSGSVVVAVSSGSSVPSSITTLGSAALPSGSVSTDDSDPDTVTVYTTLPCTTASLSSVVQSSRSEPASVSQNSASSSAKYPPKDSPANAETHNPDQTNTSRQTGTDDTAALANSATATATATASAASSAHAETVVASSPAPSLAPGPGGSSAGAGSSSTPSPKPGSGPTSETGSSGSTSDGSGFNPETEPQVPGQVVAPSSSSGSSNGVAQSNRGTKLQVSLSVGVIAALALLN